MAEVTKPKLVLTNPNYKPLGLNLNREQASMLLKGLTLIPDTDKTNVAYKSLEKDLNNILLIWDRRIKNERIIQEENRKARELAKAPKTSEQHIISVPPLIIDPKISDQPKI